jgi:hypothetical protein
MSYPVSCSCGQTVHATAGDAGAYLTCACGQKVEIPALSELRAAANELPLSAEFMIEQMLRANELPGHTDCARCGVASADLYHCHTTCERAESRVEGGPPDPFHVLAGCFFGGWLYMLLSREGKQRRQLGRDVHFPLPVRLCPNCRSATSGEAAIKDVLRHVRVYQALLEKYPRARVTLDHSPSG